MQSCKINADAIFKNLLPDRLPAHAKAEQKKQENLTLVSDSGAGMCLFRNGFYIVKHHNKPEINAIGATEGMGEMNLNTCDGLTKTTIEDTDRILRMNDGLDASKIPNQEESLVHPS